MDPTIRRTLPLFIDWMHPRAVENSQPETTCETITKIALLALEIFLLTAANVLTVLNINWIPSVFSEGKILCRYLFSEEKKITIIPTNPTTTPDAPTIQKENKVNPDTGDDSFGDLVQTQVREKSNRKSLPQTKTNSTKASPEVELPTKKDQPQERNFSYLTTPSITQPREPAPKKPTLPSIPKEVVVTHYTNKHDRQDRPLVPVRTSKPVAKTISPPTDIIPTTTSSLPVNQ